MLILPSILPFVKEQYYVDSKDYVVIQESGEPFNLMAYIPIEAKEIESLMLA